MSDIVFVCVNLIYIERKVYDDSEHSSATSCYATFNRIPIATACLIFFCVFGFISSRVIFSAQLRMI